MQGIALFVVIVVAVALGAIVLHVYTAQRTQYDQPTNAEESFEHPYGIPSVREVVLLLVIFACIGLLLGVVRGGV